MRGIASGGSRTTSFSCQQPIHRSQFWKRASLGSSQYRVVLRKNPVLRGYNKEADGGTARSNQFVELDEEQHAAVFCNDRIIRVIAGPGSGKTRVLSARAHRLLDEGVSFNNILILTHTNKAKKEAEERICPAPAGRRSGPCYTFHSFSRRFLRLNIAKLPGPHRGDFKIYNDEQCRRIVADIVAEGFGTKIERSEGVNDVPNKQLNRETTKLIWKAIETVKMRMVTCHEKTGQEMLEELEGRGVGLTADERWGLRLDELGAYIDEYEKRMGVENALGFDDLLGMTVAVLQKCDDVKLGCGHWEHIMVDEFQDASGAQYEIIKLLMDQECDPHTNLFSVLDPNQSIYMWRDANPQNIASMFERDFQPNTVLHLTTNYRSYQDIPDAAGAVLCEEGPPPLYKPSIAVKGPGGKGTVMTLVFSDDETEAEDLLQRFLNYEGSLNDIAVLYRKRSLKLSIERACITHGIPYQTVDDKTFWDRLEVKKTLAYLKLIFQCEHNSALREIINVPSRKIGPKVLDTLTNFARRQNMSLARMLFRGCSPASMRLLDLITNLKKLDSKAATLATLELDGLDQLPKGLVLRGSARQAAPGVRALRNLVYLGQCLAQWAPIDHLIDFVVLSTGLLESFEPIEENDTLGSRLENLETFKSLATDDQVQDIIMKKDMEGLGMQEEEVPFNEVNIVLGNDVQDDVDVRIGDSCSDPDDSGGGWETRLGMKQIIDGLQSSLIDPSRGPATIKPYARMMLLGEFLDWTVLFSSELELKSRAPTQMQGAISLMTVHAAKGKEFKVVAMIGCEEGHLSHPDREEERRVTYVGMTRAKMQLYMCMAFQRKVNNRTIFDLCPSSHWHQADKYVASTYSSDPQDYQDYEDYAYDDDDFDEEEEEDGGAYDG